jgi:outer membrane murein-binding lipoprotein Lpp
MKKILVAVFSFVLFLAGCSNSDKEITRIDPQDWFSRN